ncbi:hypothetical protein IW262DRAFT_515280 [Armillaria fumosa]|nr:hypothetical protein IW262DRAFT_515280 [Armillaria fumosa]
MVVNFRNRALEGPLDEKGRLHLACEGEVLRHHAAVRDQVEAWRDNVAVIPSHSPPIHPFDSHRRVFSFFSDNPYTPGEAPDDAPTIEALTREYDRWFLLTLLGKFGYDDRKASEGQNILWRLVHHNSSVEPDNREDFLRSKRDDRTQHHGAGHDEPTQTIYNNTASVSPSGLMTATMPSHSHPPPQSHHQLQAYPPSSPTAQPPTLLLPGRFDGLALIALYEQERKIQASNIKR